MILSPVNDDYSEMEFVTIAGIMEQIFRKAIWKSVTEPQRQSGEW